MAYTQRPNSGAAFPNSRKEQPQHPDFTGAGEIDGKAYWVNMWVKQGPKGEFFSLSFKPKTGGAPAESPAPGVKSYATPIAKRQKASEAQKANLSENLDEQVPF